MLVSVVIPSYNHERYIRRCVDSVISQTYQQWELIIVDDGSTDSSVEILRAYDDKRIKLVEQENTGAHAAINRGLALAKGDFLAILNSDDEFHFNRLSKCIQLFQRDQRVDLISTWLNVVDSNSEFLGVKQAWSNMEPWEIENKSVTFCGENDYALNLLMSNFVATTSNMIFKRSVFEKIGGMRNLRFAHDWDFLLRVCAQFNCYNYEESLLNYRIHNANTISTNRKWMLFEVCWVVAANIDQFAKKIIPNLGIDTLLDSSIKLLESFNFQGNDKVFWLLYWQMNALKAKHVCNPEEIYLSDKLLRDTILEYIVE